MLPVILLALISADFTRAAESAHDNVDLEVSLFGGFFTGGTLLRTTDTVGESIEADVDDGIAIGLRIGIEQEFLGLELSGMGVFSDMDLRADPAADIPSVKDASMLLANVNVLWFPIGNALADGRVRPFVTLGPDLVYLTSDYDQADNETMLGVNIGAGIKFLLGDSGNPVLRFDWRWHYIVGSTAGLENQIYRQELTAGIGIRF